MSEAWWVPFYDELVADALLRRRTTADLEETAAFLWRRLELAEGSRAFDQCCGLGQLALALAARGARISGVDLAARYVEEGQRAAAAAGLPVELVVGDAFDHVARPAVRAAYNWWTGYGYAETDADNARMLRAAYESLVPGGLYALEVPNFAAILRHFRVHEIDRVPRADGELLMLRDSALDLTTGTLTKRWTYVLPDGARREHTTRLRVYLPHQLRELLENVGFAEVTLLGGLRDEALGLDSTRLIAIARRPR